MTVIGALWDGELFTRLTHTTNASTVLQFFHQLAQAVDLDGATIVADNHRAHLNKDVKKFLEEE